MDAKLSINANDHQKRFSVSYFELSIIKYILIITQEFKSIYTYIESPDVNRSDADLAQHVQC